MKKLIMSLFAMFALTFATGALADPSRGSQSDSDLLKPEQVVTYRLMLEPNEVTRFVIRGDGDGDIDCILFDDNGNAIETDTSSYDGCVIDISPRWRAVFTLRAINNGHISSRYNFRAF